MILQGDALEQLKTLEAESIDCCITSPPYWGLRDYGVDGQLGLEPTFTEYINKLCNVFDEVKRVLKKTGSCWVNLGDTYSATRWSNSPGTGFQGEGHASNVRIEKNTNLPDKTLVQIPARFSIEMSNRGWILRNTIIWHKNNCMPASVKDRFTVDFEYLFFFVKSKTYYFEQQLEPTLTKDNLLRDRDTTKLNNTPGRSRMAGLIHNNYDERNKRAVWTINPRPFKEAHFAVYPEELLETPIKATLPPNGVVLDPFFGAGTTAAAQKRWQPSAKTIGIELNPEYIKIAKKRNAQEVLAL